MDFVAENAALQAENACLRANLDQLQQQLDQLKRLVFGHRRETFDTLSGGATLPLFDALPGDAPTLDPATTSVPEHTRRQPKRRALPDDLPRTVEVIDLADDAKSCPCCQTPRRHIGDAVSEKLDYVPARLNVIQYRRRKYACPRCEGEIAVAPLPPQPIEQGLAAPGLLAHIIVSKVADHLPLNRQAGMLRRHGVELAPSTLGDWVQACGELLEPLYRRLAEQVRQSDLLHTDDTIIPLAQKGGCKQARAWVYHDPQHRLCVYEFSENRAGVHAQAWLKDWRGYLIADAYAGYDKLYGESIREVACWAHARRKFYEIAKASARHGLAHEAVERIARLYHADNALAGLPPDARRRRRQEETRPLLDAFKDWLDAHHPRLLPKSPLAQAMGYALKNWAALIRHQEDGRLPLDNNAAERGLRPLAVGRKNWLFTGSARGGKALAVLLSFVQTCKLLELNPYAWFRDVLTRYPAIKAGELDHLLPHNWQPA